MSCSTPIHKVASSHVRLARQRAGSASSPRSATRDDRGDARADLILSDLGGRARGGPALGIRSLVLRDTTERPECVASGNALLVGTGTGRVTEAVTASSTSAPCLAPMAVPRFPFGDGRRAAHRRAGALAWLEARRDADRGAVSA